MTTNPFEDQHAPVPRTGNPVLGDWLRQYHRPPRDSPTLVVLPHAGGSAGAYRALSAALSSEAEVLLVQYPGRQDRIAERPLANIRALADAITDALGPLTGRPLALFGHSMGSMVAYEVALRLQEQPRTGGVTGLIASGRGAPSVPQPRGRHLRDDAGIVAAMAELAGTDPAVFADKELMEAIIPAMRADFEAVDTYRSAPGTTLRCPISAYAGAADPHVAREDVLGWERHTTGGFTTRTFPGGHFYLDDRLPDVVRAVRRDLAVFGRAAGEREVAGAAAAVGSH
ncbi:thioesterase II family protein [Streptomyces sp. NPDC021093]|uniref:thioesterase II family protein n=1 Tax=Streptomyces sp. NPDC021093 TaxID=3365112 RepID=UPI0037912CA3